jgi:hypothetical protein
MLANQNNSYASIVLVEKVVHQKKGNNCLLFICFLWPI